MPRKGLTAPLVALSPSLRGSGLKSIRCISAVLCASVSLFTREWIEITLGIMNAQGAAASPSLRGSGLKFPKLRLFLFLLRLPLYEGVD